MSSRRALIKMAKALESLAGDVEGLVVEVKAVQVQQEEILALLRAKEKPVKKQDG